MQFHEKQFNLMLYLLLFTFLLTNCEAETEVDVYDIIFLVENTTTHEISVYYDYVSRDCEADCFREEIADVVDSGTKLELFVTDKIRAGDLIETIFNRFEIYKDNSKTLSNFDFWDSEKLSVTKFTDYYEYKLEVDDDFFQ